MFRFCFVLLFSCFISTFCRAQAEGEEDIKQWLMTQVTALTDTAMHGRGYVKNGRAAAADYIQKRFVDIGLLTLGRKKTYIQPYTFPVNEFPGKMDVVINGHRLAPGRDFIIDETSPAFRQENVELHTLDLGKITGTDDWEKTVKAIKPGKVYYFKNIDQAIKVADINKHDLVHTLPKGCYLIPDNNKFIWSVAADQNEATVFYVKEDAMKDDSGEVTIRVDARIEEDARSENIIGYVPGAVEDSYLVVSAHYDHLGMMGDSAMFPGASDNASGTAMMLYLAHYFEAHPQKYSMVFIAFSGEEAGLIGSQYFVRNPIMQLNKIKFLTNIDIMGDATDGITVVNATEFPDQFDKLKQINKDNHFIPQVKSRGPAANSDHYFFTKAGVPSFFIYSNGGKGFYPDIFDKADELTLNNVDGAARLIIDFIKEIQ